MAFDQWYVIFKFYVFTNSFPFLFNDFFCIFWCLLVSGMVISTICVSPISLNSICYNSSTGPFCSLYPLTCRSMLSCAVLKVVLLKANSRHFLLNQKMYQLWNCKELQKGELQYKRIRYKFSITDNFVKCIPNP